MIRINLISGPRNISTALMYSFAQRQDASVLDEPYYAVYLLNSGAMHPGRDEVIASLPHTEDDVDNMINATSPNKKILFIKNMAHHMEVLREPVKDGMISVFLIRDPRQVIASYSRVVERPVMRDIGIEYQSVLFHQLRKSASAPPLVLDSGLLLMDPGSVLRQLCSKIHIDFDEAMLSWPEGPKSYDGVWAPFWYVNVHRSRAFTTPAEHSHEIPAGLETLCRQAASCYEKLLPFALKP